MSESKSTVTESSNTNIVHVFEYADAGIFRQKLEAFISEVARGVVNQDGSKKKGNINIALRIERIGESNTVMVSHGISAEIPTKRGKRTEVDVTQTPFHVGRGGKITFDQPKEDIVGQYSLNQQADGVIPVTTRVGGKQI
jgi:hypothetical protein